jgi:hypothetical protein
MEWEKDIGTKKESADAWHSLFLCPQITDDKGRPGSMKSIFVEGIDNVYIVYYNICRHCGHINKEGDRDNEAEEKEGTG